MEVDYNAVFPTWILAYCPDTNSWFATNHRFFYYEHPKEFENEENAIEYFRNNIPEFCKLTNEMYPKKNPDVFLENTGEMWTNIINFVGCKKLSEIEIHDSKGECIWLK